MNEKRVDKIMYDDADIDLFHLRKKWNKEEEECLMCKSTNDFNEFDKRFIKKQMGE